MCVILLAQEQAVSLPSLMGEEIVILRKMLMIVCKLGAMGASNVGLYVPRPLSLNSSFAMAGMGPMLALN